MFGKFYNTSFKELLMHNLFLNGKKALFYPFGLTASRYFEYGLVLNWTAVNMAGLHIDPLSIKAKRLIDATGHDAELVKILRQMEDMHVLEGPQEIRKLFKKLF